MGVKLKLSGFVISIIAVCFLAVIPANALRPLTSESDIEQCRIEGGTPDWYEQECKEEENCEQKIVGSCVTDKDRECRIKSGYMIDFFDEDKGKCDIGDLWGGF